MHVFAAEFAPSVDWEVVEAGGSTSKSCLDVVERFEGVTAAEVTDVEIRVGKNAGDTTQAALEVR